MLYLLYTSYKYLQSFKVNAMSIPQVNSFFKIHFVSVFPQFHFFSILDCHEIITSVDWKIYLYH